ncbi:MAG: hypothetical protein AMS24_01600 [Chlamydiae bacterium SM23_39]|nr:MAG: hypothetical protein AMS24_01600 [Chlamydiae bacterium SM23_39]
MSFSINNSALTETLQNMQQQMLKMDDKISTLKNENAEIKKDFNTSKDVIGQLSAQLQQTNKQILNHKKELQLYKNKVINL